MANNRITLEEIGRRLDSLIALVTTHSADDKVQFAEFHRLILGLDDSPGLKGRLDRLEQTEQARRWHVRALWAAIGGVAVAWLTKFFSLN